MSEFVYSFARGMLNIRSYPEGWRKREATVSVLIFRRQKKDERENIHYGQVESEVDQREKCRDEPGLDGDYIECKPPTRG